MKYRVNVNKDVFLSIHKTFPHKKGKTTSILLASDPDPETEPLPNVRIRSKRSGSDRIRIWIRIRNSG
jgi:hypothetical protein